MGAFVLLVRKHPGAEQPLASLRTDVDALGFVARHQVDFSDDTGAVRLRCWSEAPGAWRDHAGVIEVVAGDLRYQGPGQVSGLGLPVGDPRVVENHIRHLRGVFAAARVTSAGDGFVLSDPIGHRCLYTGENEDIIVVSSRASLAAQSLAGDATPARDALGVCWLALTSYRVGTRSGFEGISVLEPGTRLWLSRAKPTWQRVDPFERVDRSATTRGSAAEVAERTLDDLGASLRALLERPAERHVLSLTGGKDSRVVLAGALRAGLAHELVFETVGPPDLLDVRIAGELCERFGLRHEVRFVERQKSEPFSDRFRRFVEQTAGMVSGWDLQRSVLTGSVHLTGICGELLRSCQKLPQDLESGGRLAALFAPDRIGRLELLRPAVVAALRGELLERLARLQTATGDAFDAAQAHYATSRMRFTRLGAREELSGDGRFHPLYSPVGLESAWSLEGRDRHSGVLVGWMLRLAEPWLVTHRFTDHGWDARARGELGLPEAGASDLRHPSADSSPAPRMVPLMAGLYAIRAAERVSTLADAFADEDNPAWDVLDRRAVVAALDRYEHLRTSERQELFGAATAAVWLGT